MIGTDYREETYIWDNYRSQIFDTYFGGMSVCVLDIETTGLSPGNSRFVLGSLLIIGDGEATLLQYFANDVSEEEQLLKEYVKKASEYDVILTYNGKRFDVPFLLSRAAKLDVDLPCLPYNLDLYLVLNDHSQLRKLLANLKQKTVEDFMGLWPFRTDKISGAESAALYMRYLSLKESYEDTEECKELMLLHNKDDVLQLGKLLPALGKADFHRAMYSLGFPVISGGKKIIVENIKFEGSSLKVKGAQTAGPVNYISYESGGLDCVIRFYKKSSDFEVVFPLPSRGYLGLKNNNDIKYAEVNCFIKTFLLKLLDSMPEEKA